tara:strand:- start:80 stop:421 length:342 start_codon:yes stop_codon:yes gene_type:complete
MYSAICCGISGIVIFIMHFKIKFRKEIVAKYIIGLSISLLLITALMAAYLYSTNENLGTFHIFYVAVVLFTLTFLYIYKDQMKENFYLYWGLALLYLMGLTIRSITTLGEVLY